MVYSRVKEIKFAFGHRRLPKKVPQGHREGAFDLVRRRIVEVMTSVPGLSLVDSPTVAIEVDHVIDIPSVI